MKCFHSGKQEVEKLTARIVNNMSCLSITKAQIFEVFIIIAVVSGCCSKYVGRPFRENRDGLAGSVT